MGEGERGGWDLQHNTKARAHKSGQLEEEYVTTIEAHSPITIIEPY